MKTAVQRELVDVAVAAGALLARLERLEAVTRGHALTLEEFGRLVDVLGPVGAAGQRILERDLLESLRRARPPADT